MPQTRYLGRGRVEFSPLGLGCMGLSSTCGPADEGQSIRTVHRAIELGVGLFDTADVYGLGHNEKLLARALAGRRSHVLVASKLGWIWDEEGKKGSWLGVNGSPAHVFAAWEASLKRLGTDYLDFYHLHRLDANTPIEDSVGAMTRPGGPWSPWCSWASSPMP